MDTFARRIARRTVKPAVYGAIDSLFARGLPRRIDGEPIRLGIQASRFYPSTYEPEKADFLRRYCEPASTVVDVGAHFGVFTVIMARAVGSRGMVVAFEPTPSTRAALHKTVTNNRCQSVVTIRPEAVSTDDGELDFIASEHAGDMGNSLIAHAFGASDRVRVPTVRLDSVLQADHVTCLKIDAEGAEFDILRGAAAILQNQRPAVTVEIHPWALEQHGQHPRDIWSGYFDVQATPALRP